MLGDWAAEVRSEGLLKGTSARFRSGGVGALPAQKKYALIGDKKSNKKFGRLWRLNHKVYGLDSDDDPPAQDCQQGE
jgi:hypothetical protein